MLKKEVNLTDHRKLIWLLSLLLTQFIFDYSYANKRVPQTILEFQSDRNRRFIINGYTEILSARPKDLKKLTGEQKKQRAALKELHLSTPLIKQIESRLGSFGVVFRNCVTNEYGQRGLNLEALVQLCAISHDGRLESIQYVTVPERTVMGVETGNTVLSVISGYDQKRGEVLLNGGGSPVAVEASTKSKAEPEFLTRPTSCQELQGLGAGWVSIGSELSTVILDKLRQPVVSKDKSKFREVFNYNDQSIYVQDIDSSATNWGHVVAELRSMGWPNGRQPRLAIWREEQQGGSAFGGVSAEVCVQCPQGYLSNGKDDCVKNGKGLFTQECKGEKPDPGHPRCKPKKCYSECNRLQQSIETSLTNILKADGFLALDEKQKASVRDYYQVVGTAAKNRVMEWKSYCANSTGIPLCSVSASQMGIIDSWDIQTLVDSFRGCPKGSRKNYSVTCKPYVCAYDPLMVDVVDVARIQACPSSQLEMAALEVLHTDSNESCQPIQLRSQDIEDAMRRSGFHCSVYRGEAPTTNETQTIREN